MDLLKKLLSLFDTIKEWWNNRKRKERFDFIETWKLKRKERLDRANNIDK